MLDEHANNCALIALNNICDRGEREVFRVALKNGYNPRFGMFLDKMERAMTDLGIKFTEVYSYDMVNDEYITVNQARKKFHDGVFLAIVRNHVFVIANGMILDSNEYNYGVRRRMYNLYRIDNYKLPAVDYGLEPTDRMVFRVQPERASRRGSRNAEILSRLKGVESERGYITVGDVIAEEYCNLKFFERAFRRGLLNRMPREELEELDAIAS